MKFLKQIVDVILFGNIYVAFGTICLIQSSAIQLHLNNKLLPYSLLAFFATLFIYNVQRVFYKKPVQEDDRLYSIRRIWVFENNKLLKILSIIGFVGVCITVVVEQYYILLVYLSPLLILSLMYFLPSIQIRKRPWIKLITLSFVWTMVTAILPILLTHIPFTNATLIHVLTRFCFMLAICIPFDIRDMAIDTNDNVITLPLLIGEKRARMLAYIVTSIYASLIVVEYTNGLINSSILLVLIGLAIVTFVLVLMSSGKRSEYFYTALLDGTMILQGLLLMLITN